MLSFFKNSWKFIRRVSGDDAYEEYLKHYATHAHDEGVSPPLSREDFFKQWQDKKWKGVKRCC